MNPSNNSPIWGENMINRSILEERLLAEIADVPIDFFYLEGVNRYNPYYQERTVNIGDR